MDVNCIKSKVKEPKINAVAKYRVSKDRDCLHD